MPSGWIVIARGRLVTWPVSVSRKEAVWNRWFPKRRTKERPVHGLDTADPCEKRPQSRIMEFGHHFRVGDRRAALQRCRVAQNIGLVRQLRWRIHCRVLLPRFRGTRPPTMPFDGFPDRLRMRAVVGLEPLGDRGDFRGEESASQGGIVGRDTEVLPLQPLIEHVYVLRFVHDRLLSH